MSKRKTDKRKTREKEKAKRNRMLRNFNIQRPGDPAWTKPHF